MLQMSQSTQGQVGSAQVHSETTTQKSGGGGGIGGLVSCHLFAVFCCNR